MTSRPADRAAGQPPDQAERDAITGGAGLDTTVFVDAGAGTGKTTALVDRVVALVVGGVPIARIAAITFTEAAAGELRHRVRTALERVVAAAGTPAGERGRAQAALDDLGRAAFSTLHAFAHMILSDHPLEAGLPPDIAVFNDIEESAAFDLRWEAWLASFVDDAALRPALQQMDLVGLTIPRVRRLARALHADLDRIPATLATPPGPYEPPPIDVAAVRAHRDAIAALVDHGMQTAPGDKLVPRLAAWRDAADDLLDLPDDAPRTRLFAALQAIIDAESLGSVGTGAAWQAIGSPKEVRDTAKRLPAAVEAILADQADDLLAEVARWCAHFVLDWAERRRRDATLVFQDLLVGARDLLRDHPIVRDRVASRYDHILVDEFQDTDPLQVELAVLLAARDAQALAAAADASGSVPWQQASLQPGRLFFVGDPKQSIYRFRGADIAVYEGAKEFVVGDGGDLRHLDHNFRSVPGVLDWVNAVFDDLLVAHPLAQPGPQALSAARPDGPAATAVRWFGGRGDGSAQDNRVAEAEDVVSLVQSMIGREQVLDRLTDTWRPARAGDIAVLVRRHATARQLERSFDDVGLPLVVEARSLVFGTEEVRDLATFLAAVEDPNDGVAVVGSLRHPALGCSDAELFAWRRAGGGWWVPDDPDADFCPPGIDADHPVARGLARLADLRRARARHTVGGFVEHVVAELHLVELAMARPRARDRWRRIRFVTDQAHAYHLAGGHLRGFVRWLREQEEAGVTQHEHVVADPDDDAVRVTTVHAAKGLEYPIVVLLGLDSRLSRPPHDPPLLWDGDGIEVNLGSGLKTAGYQRLRDGTDDAPGARTHHEYEETRLLYVATTRARDLLVLSLHHSDPDCHAHVLEERSERYDGLWTHQPVSADARSARPPAHPPEPTQERASARMQRDADAVAAFAVEHRAVVERAGRPPVLAGTAVARLMAEAGPHRGAPTTRPHGAARPTDTPRRPRQPTLPGTAGDEPSAPDASLGAEDAWHDAGGDGADHDEREDVAVAPDGDLVAAWRRGRAGSAIGRAVHAVLQAVDLATLDGLDALAATHVAAEGLPEADAVTVAERVRRAVDTPIVRRAIGARCWRELHVGAPVEVAPGRTVAVEGFIDLLVDLDDVSGGGSAATGGERARRPGGLVVVDWKTDATRGRSPQEMVAHHRPQAATYALAVEAALGRPVERCVFVLTGATDPGLRQVDIVGDDLAQAMEDVRAALAEHAPTDD